MRDPKWLQFLSRRLQWLAIPNVAILLITLQAAGFLFTLMDPLWIDRLALIPEKVLQGEVWRLFTYLAIPLSFSPIWMVIALWFFYFILNSIESEWGAFKTTFYILVSLVLTIVFSLLLGYPVMHGRDFVSTLFLAAATLFPNYEIRMYFIFPVKLKYLGWLTLLFLAMRLLQSNWVDRFFLTVLYSNYLLFFGPTLLFKMREWKRKRDFRSKWR